MVAPFGKRGGIQIWHSTIRAFVAMWSKWSGMSFLLKLLA